MGDKLDGWRLSEYLLEDRIAALQPRMWMQYEARQEELALFALRSSADVFRVIRTGGGYGLFCN